MIIGVDGNEANVESHVGVSVYTLNLLTYFQKHSDENTRFNVYLRTKPKSFLPKETEYFKYITVPGPFAWSQFFLPLYLKIHKAIDIFFSPAHYAPRNSPIPFIVTIHDLSYFYYPDEFLKKDLYKLRNWTEYSVQNADKIIAVSKTTKKDVLKFYKVPDDRVDVIYNGYEKNMSKSDTRVNDINISDLNNYILYVGTVQPRKNLTTLMNAFSSFKSNNPEFKLVIVGKKGWLYEDIYNEVKKLHLEDSVIFTGYLSDEKLNQLYKKAFCFVLPSLYEGFGIPILEAMSHECPVLASYTASLPEIGGEACLYFDPKNPQELTDKFSMLQEKKSLRTELIQKGKERIKAFSWELCGKETLALIVDTVKSKNGN